MGPALKWCCVALVAVVGLMLIALAVGLRPAVSMAIKEQVLPTKASSSLAWTMWQSNTPGTSGRMIHGYLYNITNPEEMLNGGKPVVKEIGPFVYSYGWERFNLTWEDDKDLLQYQEWKYWVYEPTLSTQEVNDDTDVVFTSINLGFQGVYATLEQMQFLAALDFAYAASEFDRLFYKMSAREAFFGYTDPLMGQLVAMNAAPAVTPGINGINHTKEFANLTSNVHKIRTGNKDLSRAFQYVEKWGYESIEICPNTNLPENPCPNGDEGAATPAWATKAASTIRGVDGTNFPPFLAKDQELEIWVDQLMRAVPLEHTGETTQKGIKLWTYAAKDSFFANATENPANAPYYQNGARGLLNVSHVQHLAPVWLSKPHFLDVEGSAALLGAVEGISPPSRPDHDFSIYVEPTTGMVMGGAGRLQANVELSSLSYVNVGTGKTVTVFPNLKSLLMPVAWMADGGLVSEAQAKQFKTSAGLAVSLESWLPWVSGIIGGLLVLFAGFLTYSACQKGANKSNAADALLMP